MGKRKSEIIAKIKKRIECGEMAIPATNIKIKEPYLISQPFDPYENNSKKLKRIKKIREDEKYESMSSNDLYNTEESQKLREQQLPCPHEADKCIVGKHIILDYYNKGMVVKALFS